MHGKGLMNVKKKLTNVFKLTTYLQYFFDRKIVLVVGKLVLSLFISEHNMRSLHPLLSS